MRIQVLPAHVANQIAAGEVIERPASVIKELLENALDAHATRVHVEIQESGFHQIKVSDNGIGISADDLALAVAPHATSKIREIHDLNTVSTLGFRGEALASIAAISDLIIYSKPAEQAHGMKLSLERGTPQIFPCARNQGTTIEVREIFYNVPVRKKFLKSPRFEFLAIDRVVRCFALSAPTIHLMFSHNGNQILNIPAAMSLESRFARLQRILGKSFVDHASYVEEKYGHMQLSGWICRPDHQRSQNDRQWIYVNGRMVKDKLLNHAIKQSYQNRLEPGRYPICVLYLTLNPECVDVNVHPTKHEVRFQDPRAVHNFICSTLMAILEEDQQDSATAFVASKNLAKPSVSSETQPIFTSTFGTDMPSEPEGHFVAQGDLCLIPNSKVIGNPHVQEAAQRSQETGQFAMDVYDSPYQAYRKKLNLITREIQEPATTTSWEKKNSSCVTNRPGITKSPWITINERFAFIGLDAKSYLIDIHEMRCQYLKHLLEKETLPLSSRVLSVPIRYCFDRDIQAERLSYCQNLLEMIGIQLSLVGEQIALVRSLPCLLPHLELQAFLKAFFQEIAGWSDELLNGAHDFSITFLFEKLVRNALLDTNCIREEEKQTLYDYFVYERHLSPQALPVWAKHLSVNSCEKWFYD